MAWWGMLYTVHMLYPNQGDPIPTKQLEGTFASVKEAYDAGATEVLACQLRSVEAGFQIHDADGQVVEVAAEQVEG